MQFQVGDKVSTTNKYAPNFGVIEEIESVYVDEGGYHINLYRTRIGKAIYSYTVKDIMHVS